MAGQDAKKISSVESEGEVHVMGVIPSYVNEYAPALRFSTRDASAVVHITPRELSCPCPQFERFDMPDVTGVLTDRAIR